MRCFNCFKIWIDNIDTKTGICPLCGGNILHFMQHQPQYVPPNLALYSVFSLIALDLSETVIVRKVISNLFSHNIQLRDLLLLTYEHKIPNKIKLEADEVELEVTVVKINRFLIEELQFNETDAELITYYWRYALGKERGHLIRKNLKFDPLFEVVAKYVVSIQKSSNILIQQKFHIGYNRCSLISDQLEKTGITGPYDKTKFRKVNVKNIGLLEEILRGME